MSNMSEHASIFSLYSLSYPEEMEAVRLTYPSPSPIDYNKVASVDAIKPEAELQLGAYDSFYVFKE